MPARAGKLILFADKIRRFFTQRSKMTVFTLVLGCIIVFVIACFCIFAGLISPYDPYKMGDDILGPPSEKHLFGTDLLGRDVLSRCIYGSQFSISISIVTTLTAGTVGLVAATISGYVGGKVDHALLALMDTIYSFPPFVMALLVAVMLAGGYLNLALAVAIPTIPKYYRVIRSITLSVREKTFIEAERALGAGRLYIVFHHILPRCLPSLIVLITLGLADAAMTVAALGFLGYGVQPPTPEWGTDISFGARVMTQGAWWLSIFPSLMIALAVLGFNLLGEGINDTLKLQLSRL